ncbi:hypothetical protein FHR81_001863 [Actinoalloteichus hoggarensis]|uniref:Uncharacterized protein n=1 Tax=Actinoalloteichus hoggarensis TaxID=1470176 RepID=A0A221W5A2_9PSEU|nr:hypothetical protein AHOG_16340 [Actinoalloteichus hoggarensis]MBB5920825.1 hypothetical protein [Actinoalloteichus hoggarensis]
MSTATRNPNPCLEDRELHRPWSGRPVRNPPGHGITARGGQGVRTPVHDDPADSSSAATRCRGVLDTGASVSEAGLFDGTDPASRPVSIGSWIFSSVRNRYLPSSSRPQRNLFSPARGARSSTHGRRRAGRWRRTEWTTWARRTPPGRPGRRAARETGEPGRRKRCEQTCGRRMGIRFTVNDWRTALAVPPDRFISSAVWVDAPPRRQASVDDGATPPAGVGGWPSGPCSQPSLVAVCSRHWTSDRGIGCGRSGRPPAGTPRA